MPNDPMLSEAMEIVAVRRPGQNSPQVTLDLMFQSGDVLVLKGTPEPIAEAERQLLSG